MLNATASPGSIAQPMIGQAERSASMSGTSSRAPSSNTIAVPFTNERGMYHLPSAWEPATNSRVLGRSTGSRGIQKDTVCVPSMQ